MPKAYGNAATFIDGILCLARNFRGSRRGGQSPGSKCVLLQRSRSRKGQRALERAGSRKARKRFEASGRKSLSTSRVRAISRSGCEFFKRRRAGAISLTTARDDNAKAARMPVCSGSPSGQPRSRAAARRRRGVEGEGETKRECVPPLTSSFARASCRLHVQLTSRVRHLMCHAGNFPRLG